MKATIYSRIRTSTVYISVVLWGLSSWIVVNGIYSQLSILAYTLPEGYEIASHMSLALQLANIFPILLLIGSVFIPKTKKFFFDTIVVYVICGLGILFCIMLGLFWNHTAYINGHRRSYSLLLLTFLSGAIDCTTSVVYFPVISNYRYLFSSALLVGENLTGLIAGVLAIIQQPATGEPLFSVLVFCILLAVITFISGVAFTFLRFTPFGRSQLRSFQISDQPQESEMNNTDSASVQVVVENTDAQVAPEQVQQDIVNPEIETPIEDKVEEQTPEQQNKDDVATVEKKNEAEEQNVEVAQNADESSSSTSSRRWKIMYSYRLILAQCLLSFFENGILTSINPYVFGNYPFGPTLLSYAVNLQLIVAPIASLLAYWVPNLPTKVLKKVPVMGILHFIWIAGAFSQVGIAMTSPNVPNRRSLGVGISIVIMAIITKAVLSFCKTKEFLIAHQRLQTVDERSLLGRTAGDFHVKGRSIGTFRLTGFAIQAGSLAGSLISYGLISGNAFSY
ncbi:riboflavin transporter [Acrasis kona]|uniref:Riboflavin transporter n=1 Tax=Acrasis kona TaxID=1008807 RepID=A0AAW2ZAZ7_9EUKA